MLHLVCIDSWHLGRVRTWLGYSGDLFIRYIRPTCVTIKLVPGYMHFLGEQNMDETYAKF